jgi:hypothetical protein
MTATELKMELDERARLAEKYPQWHLWVSSSNRRWATRRGEIIPPLWNDYQQDPRWRMTIDADTWSELEEKINQQNRLDAEMPLNPALGRQSARPAVP